MPVKPPSLPFVLLPMLEEHWGALVGFILCHCSLLHVVVVLTSGRGAELLPPPSVLSSLIEWFITLSDPHLSITFWRQRTPDNFKIHSPYTNKRIMVVKGPGKGRKQRGSRGSMWPRSSFVRQGEAGCLLSARLLFPVACLYFLQSGHSKWSKSNMIRCLGVYRPLPGQLPDPKISTARQDI